MKISLDNISKRFQRHWIFRDVSYSFSSPNAYALLGNNGSGKSTLMRIIAGIQSPTAGKVHLLSDANNAAELSFRQVSYCAPAMGLVEEFTLREFLEFHFKFKECLPGLTPSGIIDIIGLQRVADRQIADFSSGMKQRVKLAQAIFSDTPVLLLDEPCTNLDNAGVSQYQKWISEYAKNRLVIVASNDEREHFFCEEKLYVSDFVAGK